ncbi:MAG: VOC family protein [Candidatus Hodarchaeales archaeon]|jgi:predicted enzyme related to lactoylglutathione lyase
MKNRMGVEIPVTDLEKGINFYENVFGWKFDREMIPNQGFYQFNEFTMIGIFKTAKIRPKGLNVGFEVENIDETLEKIKKAEGKVIKDKYEYAPGEVVAVFQDNFGNELSIQQSKSN